MALYRWVTSSLRSYRSKWNCFWLRGRGTQKRTDRNTQIGDRSPGKKDAIIEETLQKNKKMGLMLVITVSVMGKINERKSKEKTF